MSDALKKQLEPIAKQLKVAEDVHKKNQAKYHKLRDDEVAARKKKEAAKLEASASANIVGPLRKTVREIEEQIAKEEAAAAEAASKPDLEVVE